MSTRNWAEELKWTPEHLEELRHTGYAYIRQGKYEIALAFFEALVILDRESAYDAQTLGALYLQLNEPKKALKFFDLALKLDPNNSGPILLNLAKTFFFMGRKEEGLKLVHILKNDPDSGISNTAKALILAYS